MRLPNAVYELLCLQRIFCGVDGSYFVGHTPTISELASVDYDCHLLIDIDAFSQFSLLGLKNLETDDSVLEVGWIFDVV